MPEKSLVITYQDHLQGIISKHGNRSPEKTRALLKSALVRLLGKSDFRKIRINHICKEAGLAQGTFYIHFKNQDDIITQTLSDYSKIQCQITPDVSHIENPYDALIAYNTWYAQTFHENAALQITLMQLSEKIPEVMNIWTEHCIKVTIPYRKIINSAAKTPISTDFCTLLVYTIGGIFMKKLRSFG